MKTLLPLGGSFVMASLIALPEIGAPQALSETHWRTREDAIDKWSMGVRAEADGQDVIEIYDPIGYDWWTGGGVTAKSVARQLREITGDVTVMINSPGGSYFEGASIYNLLRQHDGRVTVKIIGLAASAASVIAMAGDEVLIGDLASIMIHNCWSIVIGDRNVLQHESESMGQLDAAMAGVYAARAGVDQAEAAEWMDNETWWTGSSAVEAGLADAILETDVADTQDPEQTSALRAELVMVNALKAQNPKLTRAECRALLSDVKAGKPRAASPVSEPDADFTAAATSLLKTLKGES